MIVIPIIVGALGTIPKSLEKRVREQDIKGALKTLQATKLLKSVRIIKRVLEPEETCCHSDFR